MVIAGLGLAFVMRMLMRGMFVSCIIASRSAPTSDLPTQMSSPIFDSFMARRDAAAVVALKRAGGYVFGKTVTAEFACARSGPTRNPFDYSRTPGGSSSGSAAAVGAGMVPAALGTQSQASIIRPASYCGVYAIKPSYGVLPLDGIAPLSSSLDHLGAFGATLEDAWAVTAAMACATPKHAAPGWAGQLVLPGRPKLRALIVLETVGWEECDTASKEAFCDAVGRLERMDVRLYRRKDAELVEAIEQLIREATEASSTIYAYESQWPPRSYLECGAGMAGERINELVAIADKTSPEAYSKALQIRARLREAVAKAECDGFLALSSSGPAIPDIAYTGSRLCAVPWTMTGGLSLSLPRLQVDGLSLGLQLMGKEGEDDSLAAIGGWIDEALRRTERHRH